jgi:hypothetical protein
MAVLYLSGVLEDGTTPRSPLVPVNPRTELEIIQHSSAQIIVRITNPANVPVPSTGTVVLTVKQKPQDGEALAQLAGTWVPSLGPGVALFSWTPATMSTPPWGRYTYDIKLTVGTEVNYIVPASPFRLSPAL